MSVAIVLSSLFVVIAADYQVQWGVPWHLSRLNSATTFKEPISALPSYTFNATGRGVNMYFVDSGIDVSHPDFTGRATHIPLAGMSPTINGKSFTECYSHGTGSAGAAAGHATGAAKEANIFSLQACCTECLEDRYVKAMRWILENHQKPAVVNLSLQWHESGTVWDQWVFQLIKAGIPVVLSAGNYGVDRCEILLRQNKSHPHAIVVGASDFWNQRTSFSNFGDFDEVQPAGGGEETCVTLYAPGKSVLVPRAGSTGFTYVDGTSFSAPIVSSIVALYLEHHPKAGVEEVYNHVLSSAVNLDTVDKAAVWQWIWQRNPHWQWYNPLTWFAWRRETEPKLLAQIPDPRTGALAEIVDDLPGPDATNGDQTRFIVGTVSIPAAVLVIIVAVFIWRRTIKRKVMRINAPLRPVVTEETKP